MNTPIAVVPVTPATVQARLQTVRWLLNRIIEGGYTGTPLRSKLNDALLEVKAAESALECLRHTLAWEKNPGDGWFWLILRPLDKRCKRQIAHVYDSSDHRTYVQFGNVEPIALQEFRKKYQSAVWAGPLPSPEKYCGK